MRVFDRVTCKHINILTWEICHRNPAHIEPIGDPERRRLATSLDKQMNDDIAQVDLLSGWVRLLDCCKLGWVIELGKMD